MYKNDISKELATRAFYNTSFRPETRGEQMRNNYSSTLSEDYEQLKKYADTPEKLALLEAEFARYRAGYRTHFTNWLQSHSRCLSSMITGPAKFPIRRAEKANNAEHNRMGAMIDFRERALKAIEKALRPELRAIMSGDDNALERLHEKLEKLEALQAEMKAINAAHKAYLKKTASLDACGLSEERKTMIRNYKPEYSWEPHPIAPFMLTNNSAQIRTIKKRIEKLTKNKAAETTSHEGKNARLEDCPADNRIRLFFPGKPNDDIREALKSHGFRWSPKIGAWQAYRNWRSIELAKQIAA